MPLSRTIFRTTIALTLLTLAGASATADTLDLDLNDDAARVTYAHAYEVRKTRVDASWLHHQDRGDVLSLGFHITGNAATQERPVNAGIGGRVIYMDAEGVDLSGSALAVGGFFDAKIPSYNRIGIGGHLYYAPDVIAFGDATEFVDVSIQATYAVLRQGDVYLGLRSVRGEFDQGGSQSFDTGLHIGFRLNF